MFKRIGHVEIVALDFERAIHFFIETLGLKMRERKRVKNLPLQEIAYLELNGTVAELMFVKEPELVSLRPRQGLLPNTWSSETGWFFANPFGESFKLGARDERTPIKALGVKKSKILMNQNAKTLKEKRFCA